MSSPVHRLLFSPPSSPTLNPTADHSPVAALRDFLLPGSRQHSADEITPLVASPKRSPSPTVSAYNHHSNNDLGPGGFNSTRAYPSRFTSENRSISPVHRLSRDSKNTPTFQIPLIPAAVTVTIPLDDPSPGYNSKLDVSLGRTRVIHRRNQSVPQNQPTVAPLSVQRPRSSWTLPRPVFRILLLISMLVMSGYLFAYPAPSVSFWRSSNGEQVGAPSVAQDELSRLESELIVQDERAEVGNVSGKLVVVSGKKGSPRRILNHKQGFAAAPPRVYRPHKSAVPVTPELELLALQSYLLANVLHTIPETTETSKPLEPVTLLGFNPKDASGWKELKEDVEPVVIWDVGHTWTAPVHDLLALYAITPGPRSLPLSTRSDAEVIERILARLVPGRAPDSTNPLITIAGRPIDGYQELLELHQNGELYGLLERAGAVVDGQKTSDESKYNDRLARAQKKVQRK